MVPIHTDHHIFIEKIFAGGGGGEGRGRGGGYRIGSVPGTGFEISISTSI